MIQSNLKQYKIIEDNIINIDFLDETEFYFHQFIAMIQSKENEFYVISDNLKLYIIDIKQKISTNIIDLRDQLSSQFDITFIKDKFNNIFIYQQDFLHLIRIDSIQTYQLISREQRYSIIYHPYNYFITSVGINSIDIYQIEYTLDNQIQIKYHSNTISQHLNVIGISFHKLDEKNLFILDKTLGIIVAEINEQGQIKPESQHPINIDNPLKIIVAENELIVASDNLLQKYQKNTFHLLRTQKLNNIQQIKLNVDGDDLLILGYNKHFISDLEWKFFGLHDLILNKNEVIVITGTNFYIGSILRLPYRIICSPTNQHSKVEYTLTYKTKSEEHQQQYIIQQIEYVELNQYIKSLLSLCFVLSILSLFLCAYVQKMKSLHSHHERIRRKLENQQHTRITMNSQIQIQNESLSFELPYFKETNITTICDAKDTQLISNNNEPFCWLEQLNLEYDTKLQPFDKIVTMAHIRDGILVITSDFFLYMLKFNYQNFSSEFAKITWKADFKELGLDSTAEIPSLLYCSTSNLGILFYSWTAMIFSVQQMEQKSQSLSVKEISDLRQRKERGVTKEYDNYIFSCVGEQGLDIYKISGTELHFIDEIQGHRVKDLVIIKQDQTFYLILLEDSTPSIIVYEMDASKIRTSIKLLYQIITKNREYVAVDNHQNNIFVVFKQHHKYVCIEYLFTVKDFIYLNEFTTYSKIKDVDVTEDFAILQGQDKHKIMFVTKFDGLQIKHVPRFIISGVMDIEVFYLTNIDLQMSHLQDSNNFSLEKFFFGSSKSGLFYTRYKFQEPYVVCYAENSNKENEQFYQIISNESISFSGDITQNIVIQRTTNFTITAYNEQDNDYMKIVAYLGIPIGGTFLLMGIIAWYITKKKEVEKLETEISSIKSKRASALTAAVELQPQILQMINQQGVMSPFAVTARNDLKTNLAKEGSLNADG